MNNREMAIEFVRSFCMGDVESLGGLLADDFRLRGPLFRFDSKVAYLDSLREDALERSNFSILNVTEDDDCVCVFYEYVKKASVVTVAQLFRFNGREIIDTLLVFDRGESA